MESTGGIQTVRANEFKNIYSALPKGLLNIKRALIVEDDPFSRKYFSKVLSDRYYNLNLIFTSSYEEALAAIKKYKHFDLVILDIFLGDKQSGVELYLLLNNLNNPPAVIMTSSLEVSAYQKLFPRGTEVPPFLKKPFRPDVCIDMVDLFTGGDLT